MRHRKLLMPRILSSLMLSAVTALSLLDAAYAAPAVVVDVKTGMVTSAEEADRRWSPASLTKLMTAYVTFRALSRGELDMLSPVRMSSNAASEPPSKMGYAVGSVMTIDNALKMLIIKSANDVSVALAEAVSGTEEAFVAQMNREAQRLGMAATNFVNANGLHDANQYTTARDMAALARAIRLEFPQYDGYFAAEGIQTGDTVTPTYNLLLGRYSGADGMKTGFVCASGFNIVASATRDGSTLVAVVMGETSQKSRAEKSANVLDAGFAALRAGTTMPNLATLPRDAVEAGLPVADLSSRVCTEEARASRWDGRQIEGYITFSTDSIGTLNRSPQALRAGLGGASGTSKAATVLNGVVIGSYPIPQPK
ncbi:MAG: D-alanyl-D-alanine carboxypeptidase family protein, partial [Ahrensia sp.]